MTATQSLIFLGVVAGGGFGRGISLDESDRSDRSDQSEGVAGALWEGKVGVARSGGGGGRELWGVAGVVTGGGIKKD